MHTIPLIFRCDASSELGWGHFQRCYSLAEIAAQSGCYKVHFVSRTLPKGLEKKVDQIHATVHRVPDEGTLEDDLRVMHSTFDLLSRKHVIVVVDHYDWTAEMFHDLKQDQRVVMVAFDDGLRRHYDCDFLINQNLEAEKIAYSTSENAQRLLGPKYVMVRDEIFTLRQHPTERMADSFHFLVTLGGGDHHGHALKAIEAARMSTVKFETHVVVGSQWPHIDRAKKVIGNHPRIHVYEDPSFFPQLLARADLALCGAGSTTYELSYLGIPMMTTALVAHQTAIGHAWQDLQVSEHLGTAEQLSPELILQKVLHWIDREQELEERGMKAQKLVDGRGKFRVLERVAKFIEKRKEAA